MGKSTRSFTDSAGTMWRVQVGNVGSSNAQIVFQHPDPRRTRDNRYAHYISSGVETQNVSARLDPKAVLSTLDEPALARLFRRSMQIAGRPSIEGEAF